VPTVTIARASSSARVSNLQEKLIEEFIRCGARMHAVFVSPALRPFVAIASLPLGVLMAFTS